MEGPLSKWTNVMKGWQYRWFVLDDGTGLFSYYTSRDKMIRGVRRGCVRLKGAVIGIDDEDEATFTITVDNKTFHFQAKDSEERERWIRALEDTVLRHNQNSSREGKANHHHRRASRNRAANNNNNMATMEEFDKKLAETDSYLDMMLSQLTSVDSAAVVQKAADMAESVKHAIVLLQIAKNATIPQQQEKVKEFRSAASADVSQNNDQRQQQVLSDSGSSSNKGDLHHHHHHQDSKISQGESVEQQQQQQQPAQKQQHQAQQQSVVNKSSAIPEVSYSSSEDEDFFDAEDDDDDDECDNHKNLSLDLNNAGASPVVMPINSPLTPGGEDIDYDALYEDEEDETNVDMNSHGSVITHLLSQVRIGMDLTKIVLPTFILERRSLLEMYSDFFAHPDLFVGITDGKTPEERMIRVLRWYLSSFHAGRKSSIAKKPYNPIIGETFRCHWADFPGASPSSTDPNPRTRLNESGPLPWCGPDDLTFVAEQVSHHPPISAFYAEHPAKRISVNAHIYTKSSFLGMSVAVHNVGQGKLTLMDHDEEYICTFPSGFGRSILTVPWIELGGKVSVTCPQTQYLANIEFKCKQFFSSDVNKISAEVFQSPSAKKPILKVDGEWNGRMMAKWASGKNEVFVDVGKIPIAPKECKRVKDQARFESRRLWKDVTYNLKVNNIEAATGAKFALEQRQREEAAERKEKGEKWQTKLFMPIGENWQFMEPLEKRKIDAEKKQ